jgi:hypothetical protein
MGHKEADCKFRPVKQVDRLNIIEEERAFYRQRLHERIRKQTCENPVDVNKTVDEEIATRVESLKKLYPDLIGDPKRKRPATPDDGPNDSNVEENGAKAIRGEEDGRKTTQV